MGAVLLLGKLRHWWPTGGGQKHYSVPNPPNKSIVLNTTNMSMHLHVLCRLVKLDKKTKQQIPVGTHTHRHRRTPSKARSLAVFLLMQSKEIARAIRKVITTEMKYGKECMIQTVEQYKWCFDFTENKVKKIKQLFVELHFNISCNCHH